uniref:DUP1365 proein n=1 Tax=Oryza meridionalis TaxID=40149 RepID=A0A0E0E7J5_9ORYZ
MEALYLVASLATTLLTSTFLSLLLLLRLLLTRRPPLAGGGGDGAAVRLYEGRVRHSRRRPAAHAFEYPVRYALVDLDRLPLPGHLSPDDARRVASTSGPVHVLTIPKSVGYEQNPLSIYYCYDSAEQGEDEKLKMCIAEVTNTPWGERVMFTFQPGSDLVAKPLHVSPFMDMLGNWSIRAESPGDSLYVVILVQHPTLGNYFTAALHAKLVEKTSSSLRLATFFWLMPHKVAAGIYWEAVRLWLKSVKFLDHPRYLNLNYRDEAQKRDLEIRSSCSFLQKQKLNDQRTGRADETAEITDHHDHNGEESVMKRWCVWTDAQWPWS